MTAGGTRETREDASVLTSILLIAVNPTCIHDDSPVKSSARLRRRYAASSKRRTADYCMIFLHSPRVQIRVPLSRVSWASVR